MQHKLYHNQIELCSVHLCKTKMCLICVEPTITISVALTEKKNALVDFWCFSSQHALHMDYIETINTEINLCNFE